MSAVRVCDPLPHVRLIEIDRPPANALDQGARAELTAALEAADADRNLRALVLTGAGGTFCSGADLREAAGAPEHLHDFARLLARVEATRMPVIAAIEGWCVGGGLELASCCAVRLASTQARFVCAGVNVGLTASAYRLPRLIGPSRALPMLLTGLPQTAETMERVGFITELHAPEALLPAALTLADRIASRAPLAVEATLRLARRAVDLDPAVGLAVQAEELARLTATADHADALAAFAEKRPPTFTGA